MPAFTHGRRLVSVLSAAAIAALGLGTAHTAHAATSSPATKRTGLTAAAPSQGLTRAEALREAKATGKPVAIPGAESATDTLQANPDGTFTLTTANQPVRAKVAGVWHNLDATLKKNPDGTYSPTLSTEPLVISGGGTGPLATMRSGLDRLGLRLPLALPAPTIAGASATYHNVIPGVDLVVTATSQGGFSDVYVVNTPQAATDPRLTSLLTAQASTTGVKLTTDNNGGIDALDARGRAVFSAPAPAWWDSTTTAPATTAPTTAASSQTGTGASRTSAATGATGARAGTRSSVRMPGTRAHVGHLTARVSGQKLVLSPDQAPATQPASAFPLYYDPDFSGSGGANTDNGWATVAENFPDSNYYDSSPEAIGHGLMQVGQSNPNTGSQLWADTLINFHLPAELGNEGTSVDITGATFYITATATDSCTAQTVDLYAPGQTLWGGSSGNATWNDWFTSSRNLGSAIGSASVDEYPPGSCGSNDVGFPITNLSWISSDVNSGKYVQTLALAGTSYAAEQYNGDGAGQNDYAVFDQNTPVLAITFSHTPNPPSNLHTTPNQNPIGNGPVTLDATAKDPDGSGQNGLTASFTAYLAGHPTDVIKSGSVTVGNQQVAQLYIPQNVIAPDVHNTAWGLSAGNTTITVDWSVTVSNDSNQSATSSVQSFVYSTSVPGAPDIYTDSAETKPCQESKTTDTVGQPVTFYIKANSSGATVASYTYQLNGHGGQTVNYSSNNATPITVVPSNTVNILTVNATATNSNVGQPTDCVFYASAPANAVPGDLTGSGNPDLLIPGQGSSGLPAGLWLAPATSTGQVSSDAINIGQYGTGVSATDTSAASFTGTKVATGLFSGTGFNDVLVYNPNPGQNGVCSAEILNDDGDTTPLDPDWGMNVLSPVVTYMTSQTAGTCASAIANAGGLYAAEGSGPANPLTSWVPGPTQSYQPDLLMIANGSLYLDDSHNVEGDYDDLASPYVQGLSDVNPYCAAASGTCSIATSWANWQILTINTTADIPEMFAIDVTDNLVYYYSPTVLADLAYNVINSPGTPAPSTPTQVTGLTLQKGDYYQATTINGAPALWDTDLSSAPLTKSHAELIGIGPPQESATTRVATYQLNGSVLTPTGEAVVLRPSDHSWTLNDQPASGSTLTSAADSDGDTMTGHGAVTGYSHDIFEPDASFDGKTGYLTDNDTIGAIDPSQDFSLSVWAKPEVDGDTVFAESGTDYVVIGLAATSYGQWQFGMNTTSDGSKANYVTITGGAARLGIWTQLTVTYNTATGVLTMYADGNEIAVGTDTTPPSGGTATIGAQQTGRGSIGDYFYGEIADLETFDSVAMPLIAEPGASDFVPLNPTRIIDTRSTSKIGNIAGPVAAGSTGVVQIENNTTGGIDIPATGVTAVAVSITATGGTSSGYLSAYPDLTPQPITSTVSYSAGATTTNNAITPLGPDGEIAIYNSSSGTVQYYIDVTGYYTTDTTLSNASTYVPLTTPTRFLDTAAGIGAPQKPLAANSDIELPIAANTTGGANIPAAGITAVAINLTAYDASTLGQLTVYPDGATRPNTSNLTYTNGQIDESTVVVPVGVDGKIDIHNQSTATSIEIAGDVSGYYTTATTGQHYFPTGSDRILDTRTWNPLTNNAAPVAAHDVINLPIPPTAADNDPTLVLNLTVTQPNTNGNYAIYPGDQGTAPNTTAIAWQSGQTVANLSVAASAAGDGVNLYNDTTGNDQLIIDTNGYFAYGTPDLTAGAITHDWPMNEGAGNLAADAIGTSSLTLTGGYTWDTTATIGNQTAQSNVPVFDGTTGYAQAQSSLINTAASYTISAWANPTTDTTGPGQIHEVASLCGTNHCALYLEINASGNWELSSAASDSSATVPFESIDSGIPATLGIWTHLIGVYDATAKTLTLYINGTAAGHISFTTPWAATGIFTIGASNYPGVKTSSYFNGAIADVETYNYPMNPTQAAALYQQEN